jgi:alpha-1,3-rhamnosyl/mannosyltransferase
VDQGYAHLVRAVRKPTVVTVHDLIPLLRWHGALPGTGRGRPPLLNLFAFSALRLADRVLADSHVTARDAAAHARVSPTRLRVAPLGLRAPFERLLRCPLPAAPRGSGAARVLLSGSGFYKNHDRALAAVGRVVRAGTEVVVVKLGGTTPAFQASVARAGLAGRVVCPGWVDVADLPQLYIDADVLLFPSVYEGYGWPPFEAMACGVPVVASAVGALADEARGAYLEVAPEDVEGMARALLTTLQDEGERRRLIAAGTDAAARLSWTNTVGVTAAAYRELA